MRRETDQARAGMLTQLESFTHHTSQFLRREEDLLLDGRGLPDLGLDGEGRPVVVVTAGPHQGEDLDVCAGSCGTGARS